MHTTIGSFVDRREKGEPRDPAEWHMDRGGAFALCRYNNTEPPQMQIKLDCIKTSQLYRRCKHICFITHIIMQTLPMGYIAPLKRDLQLKPGSTANGKGQVSGQKCAAHKAPQ